MYACRILDIDYIIYFIMKFTDYLTQLQSTTLSPESKELIFRRFEAKKPQKWFFARVTNYSRVATLSLVAISLLGILYFSSFGGQESGEWKADDGLITFKADPAQPLTYADEIGTIIQTVWGVTITSNGELKETDNLVSSDKVLLLEWAEMTFSVQDWVQAKIVWPAEFEVEKVEETYVINMLSGEFVELKSIDPAPVEEVIDTPTQIADSTPIIKEKLQPKKSVKVIVKTPEFEVSSDTDDGEIDVTISTQDDGKQLVANTGAELMITRVIKDESVVTELKPQQTASINGEVTIADIVAADPQITLNEDQAQELVATLKDDLTISYAIDDEPTNTVAVVDPIQDTQKSTILAPAPTEKVSDPAPEADADKDVVVLDSGDDIVRVQDPVDQLPDQIQELVQDEPQSQPATPKQTPPKKEPSKRVIWDTDLRTLQWATNAWVLMRSIRTVVSNYAQGNTAAASNGLVGIANTLGPVSTLVWGVSLDRSSPAGLANSLQAMTTMLETQRFVPPVYISKIKSVIARLRLIQTIPSGSVDPLCDFTCIVDEVLEVPASQRWYLML